jgi:hypothetical protein
MNNSLNNIIYISAGTLAFTILDFVLQIFFGTSVFELLPLDVMEIWSKLIIFVVFFQVIGIIASINKLKTGVNGNEKTFILIYLFIAILFFLIMVIGFLVGSSADFHQPY